MQKTESRKQKVKNRTPASAFLLSAFCFLFFRFDNSGPLSKLTPLSDGVVAQLVERLNGIEKVAGSRPVGSTIASNP
jgi:hypothetical protein